MPVGLGVQRTTAWLALRARFPPAVQRIAENPPKSEQSHVGRSVVYAAAANVAYRHKGLHYLEQRS